MNEHKVSQRRAIEALRSGVPNRYAVRVLGSSQTAIEQRFHERLRGVQDGTTAGGLLIGGDFGSGKSHLLEFLQHRALEQRFVASKVVISKETPLHDPTKVFRAAIGDAVVPGRRGMALKEIASSLHFDSRGYTEFFHWVDTPEAKLNERFAATLYLFEHLRDDLEFSDRIVRFWSGDPIAVGDLRRKLRESGESATWNLSKVSARDLSLQRFRFVAGLIRAAGYAGWVLLFDEVELIGRYSLLQRAKAYAEMARWVVGFESEPLPGLTSVLAITQDFATAVLDQKRDYETIPNRLRARGNAADELTALQAEQGMRILENPQGLMTLEPQSSTALQSAYEKLRRIHGEAYDWEPPDVAGLERRGSRPMRQYVRSWIYEWDLRRLDPSYAPEIEVETIQSDYSEDAELAVPSESDPPQDDV
ncbi:MAG: DUF2791 family P-loop domain-containing protein [Gemmatimonadetes bacterium]|nr:DUF2791 family P-loop domain-containing protein [Gemmatimonadota bacterium]